VNIHDPSEALIAAAGGTLCVSTDRLPEGFEQMISRWRESKARIQLMLCAPSMSPVLSAASDPIVVVPLSMRWHDRFRIMNDVITETAAEFGIPAIEISRADRELIVASEAETLPELETTTARVVAIRHWAEGWGGLGRAAGALGISRASLAECAERRGLIAVRHRGKAGQRRRARVAQRRWLLNAGVGPSSV